MQINGKGLANRRVHGLRPNGRVQDQMNIRCYFTASASLMTTRTGLFYAGLQFRYDDVTQAPMFILRTAVFGLQPCLSYPSVLHQHPPPGNTVVIPRVLEGCVTAGRPDRFGCVRNVPTGSLTAVVRCRTAGGIPARQIASLRRRRPPKSHHDPHTTTTTTTTKTDRRDCY